MLCLVLPASAQNIQVVAGNGQVICPGCQNATNVQFQLLTVKVTDSSGNPLQGQTVNWSINGQSNNATLGSTSNITGPDGTASNILFVTNFSNSAAFQS